MADFALDLDNLLKKGTEGNQEGTPAGDNQGGNINYEQQYKELQTKFGELGTENGKWRAWFDDTQPLLLKLAENENALATAILDDKITPDLAKAVLGGEIKLDLADLVNKAHDQVKKDLGKDYKDQSNVDIEKLVEAKAKDLQKGFEEKLNTFTKQQKLDSQLKNFINNTPDLDSYIEDIDKYLDDHEEIKDIEVAYHAVKGMRLSKLSDEDKEKFLINWEKELASNASGGSSKGTQDPNKDMISSYLGL